MLFERDQANRVQLVKHGMPPYFWNANHYHHHYLLVEPSVFVACLVCVFVFVCMAAREAEAACPYGCVHVVSLHLWFKNAQNRWTLHNFSYNYDQ